MPRPAHAALTPSAARIAAHAWPVEIAIVGCCLARRPAASRALSDAIAALIESGALGEIAPPSQRAIVVGTQSAAVAETMQFAREICEIGASLVNPALFPLTVMNAASGLAAIQHRCEGPNVTLSNGPGSALDALVYAADLVAEGRAALVFAGGFEVLADAPPGEAALAAMCAIMARERAAGVGAGPCVRVIATASSAADPLSPGADDLAPALAAAAADAGRGAPGPHAAVCGRTVVVETPAETLAALAGAVTAAHPITIVARRKGEAGGTALVLGSEPADER